MNKLWTIIQREYLTNVRKPAFLFSAFGTPIFILAIIGISIFIAVGGEQMDDLSQVGYVDNAGVLAAGVPSEDYPDLFVPYESEEAGRAALDAGTADAYFVIPEQYMQTGQVQVYSYDGTPGELEDVMNELLAANLTAQLDTAIPPARLIDPADATIEVRSTGRELTSDAIAGIIILPIVFTVVFMLAIQITSGFLMGGLVEEKTNRLIEMLVTSVTPMQLLTGKLIGLGLLGLTQIAAWLLAAFVAVMVGRSMDIPILRSLVIPPDLVFFGLLYFFLGYFLVGSLLAALGVLSGSEAESRQYAGVLSVVFVIPIYVTAAFIADANGTVPVVLSLFPFTAPTAMIMRMGFVAVPGWQIALSVGLLLVTMLFFVWASARIFRWALLLYGKRFNLREVLAVLRGNPYAYNPPQPTQEARASSG